MNVCHDCPSAKFGLSYLCFCYLEAALPIPTVLWMFVMTVHVQSLIQFLQVSLSHLQTDGIQPVTCDWHFVSHRDLGHRRVTDGQIRWKYKLLNIIRMDEGEVWRLLIEMFQWPTCDLDNWCLQVSVGGRRSGTRRDSLTGDCHVSCDSRDTQSHNSQKILHWHANIGLRKFRVFSY